MAATPTTPTLVNMEAPSLTASPAPSPVPVPTSAPAAAQEQQLVRIQNGSVMRLPHRLSIEPIGAAAERYDAIIARQDEGLNDPNASVVIVVEDNQFNAPMKQLIQNSSFFRTKIHNLYGRTPVPTVSLPRQDVHAVEVFIEWIKGRSALRMGGTIDLRKFSYQHLFLCFVLGENIQAMPFQNDIMDVISAKLIAGHPLEPCLPELAYSNTPKGSPLRRLIIDAYARDAGPNMILAEEAQEFLNAEFLKELCAALLCVRDEQYKAGPRPYAEGSGHCPRYHNHDIEGGFRCAGRKFDVADETPIVTPPADMGEAPATTPEYRFSDPSFPRTEQYDRETPTYDLIAGQSHNEAERQGLDQHNHPNHPSLPTPESSATSNRVRFEENVRGIPGPSFVPLQPFNAGAQMPPSAALSTPQSTIRRKAAPKTPRGPKSPAEPVIKEEEPQTPCPPPSKKRRMLQKSGGTMDKPIELD
ncbi:hypothetical protein K461DRAFT_323857 [Myriangium duriaei CBS 260.36]|uniref:BTB domain-containing protein n=1 Tax=Myriangium duriaei CBS 260.36 TaxID=1168546 RepID=A0A9P4IV55_9PEZI|nr:hypothetical protein K461DRAFT_323857 [Myriangium duriaei CBS 260.36]